MMSILGLKRIVFISLFLLIKILKSEEETSGTSSAASVSDIFPKSIIKDATNHHKTPAFLNSTIFGIIIGLSFTILSIILLSCLISYVVKQVKHFTKNDKRIKYEQVNVSESDSENEV
mmetsp:Transcript_37773/g.46810  ORF Transcript_37773/g.46810 Transcript_37773/m.46810 type:complete len:118 (+) Transcript_37773:50-403(+)